MIPWVVDVTYSSRKGPSVCPKRHSGETADFSGAGSCPIRLAGSILSYRAHICAFFNNSDDAYRVLLPFIQEGLECGEKAVQTADPGD